jgi:hypothetical protein
MYKTGAVCAATGVPPAMLGRWADRRTLKPCRRDKASSGSGDHRLFSKTTVYRIAIAKMLTDLGVAASPANRAAVHFTELHEIGRTLLLVNSTGAAIINTEYNASLTDIAGRPFGAAIILDIGQIISSVDQALTRKIRN